MRVSPIKTRFSVLVRRPNSHPGGRERPVWRSRYAATFFPSTTLVSQPLVSMALERHSGLVRSGQSALRRHRRIKP